jgi:hypothetical protein
MPEFTGCDVGLQSALVAHVVEGLMACAEHEHVPPPGG